MSIHALSITWVVTVSYLTSTVTDNPEQDEYVFYITIACKNNSQLKK